MENRTYYLCLERRDCCFKRYVRVHIHISTIVVYDFNLYCIVQKRILLLIHFDIHRNCFRRLAFKSV